jgi:lysine/ornithine N-monooxygenase
LAFDDGTKIEADVVIFATGFRANLEQTVKDLLGEEVSTQVEDYWGLDHQGEINGAFRPSKRKYANNESLDWIAS